MKNTLLKLGGVAVAIGGAYLYMKNKSKKEQAQALASMQVAEVTSQPAVTTDSGTYTKDEAKKLAMSVVEKTIKLYDEVPKDRLTDKHRSIIQQEEFKAKENEYKKAKALAIKDKKEQFTFLDKTYTSGVTNKGLISTTSKGGDLVENGKVILGAYNPYEASGYSEVMSQGNFFIQKTLGDQANKFKKAQGWIEAYDLLVNAFSKMPKSQVDLLLPILPKMLFTAQPYAYLQEYLEKNPYSLQETLIIREANLEQYKPERDNILGTKIRELVSITANAGIK
jgi:hypothetical protein